MIRCFVHINTFYEIFFQMTVLEDILNLFIIDTTIVIPYEDIKSCVPELPQTKKPHILLINFVLLQAKVRII